MTTLSSHSVCRIRPSSEALPISKLNPECVDRCIPLWVKAIMQNKVTLEQYDQYPGIVHLPDCNYTGLNIAFSHEIVVTRQGLNRAITATDSCMNCGDSVVRSDSFKCANELTVLQIDLLTPTEELVQPESIGLLAAQ